jgi:hypothetical protein
MVLFCQFARDKTSQTLSLNFRFRDFRRPGELPYRLAAAVPALRGVNGSLNLQGLTRSIRNFFDPGGSKSRSRL